MAENHTKRKEVEHKKRKASTKSPNVKSPQQTAEGVLYPSVSKSLLTDGFGDMQGVVDPYEVYARFASRYNNFDDPSIEYMTDRELGEAIIATQGYLAPIALKYGVSIKGLRERVKKTPLLNSIFDSVKGLHIDSVEHTLMAQAIKGESWAVKMVLLGTDAKDRGYQPDREEGVLDLGKILRQRIEALNSATDSEYETNDRKLYPPKQPPQAWRDKGYHTYHADETYDENQESGKITTKTITVMADENGDVENMNDNNS